MSDGPFYGKYRAIVTMNIDPMQVGRIQVMCPDVAGFIPKTSPAGVMQEALRTVLDGGVYLPPPLLAQRAAAAGIEPDAAPMASELSSLTPRQCEVLRLLIEGKTNKLICRELELSESTVKTHLASIFRRLGATSRTQAVVAAARMGLQLGPAVSAGS